MEEDKYRRDPQLHTRVYHGWKEDYWHYLTPTDFMVYSCIAGYADWTTGEGSPTFRTIHLDNKISIDAIRNSIHWLETIGVIWVEFRKARNLKGVEYGRKRNHYTLAHRANKLYDRKHNRVSPEQVESLWESRING